MDKWFANHEVEYIIKRKAGKKMNEAAPLDVHVKKVKVAGDYFAFTATGKGMSLRKNDNLINRSQL